MIDILDEVHKWASFKQGDIMPNDWGPALTKVLLDAEAEITKLRETIKDLEANLEGALYAHDGFGV